MYLFHILSICQYDLFIETIRYLFPWSDSFPLNVRFRLNINYLYVSLFISDVSFVKHLCHVFKIIKNTYCRI